MQDYKKTSPRCSCILEYAAACCKMQSNVIICNMQSYLIIPAHIVTCSCVLYHATVPCHMQPHLDVNWLCILCRCYPYLSCGWVYLLFLVLLKERMWVTRRFYLFCFWCPSRKCGGPVSSRFPCVVV